VAAEGGLDVDVYALFEAFAAQIPVLTGVRPVGSHTIEQLEAAGGGRGVMKRLEAWLDTGALTVTGRTVKDNLAEATIADDDVIRPPQRAFANHPAIVLVRG
ncbi:dihydroxy-acid dehydratase domain-containing protein, partial [Burkholderia sola]